jgi:hypothetical protein|tara:strand:+ start:5022 stop:5183 length:162 start_codon:yes stop_codon:yes gene_type:complete
MNKKQLESFVKERADFTQTENNMSELIRDNARKNTLDIKRLLEDRNKGWLQYV